MLERILRCLLVVAFAATSLSGCAYMSKNGRQQMAYQRYVRKMSGQRMKIQKKTKAPKMPHPTGPSDNQINTGVGESPQSVRSAESQQEPQPRPQQPPQEQQ